ncbi:MAG: biotin--[acetyl-CoA-carboxylase] ligase [Anaerolineae bacterium]|nr:biotin--[acetyl-CoA-carboxylase] ligase [Anaerolineae bacterium]
MKYRFLRFDSVASTMPLSHEFAMQGEQEGLVVIADEQTAGRGRAGHTWFSPPAQSLYLSILLRPALPAAQLNWLTMIGALAIIDTVQSLVSQHVPRPPQPSIKWFNDVNLNGRKVSGVLVETAWLGDAIDYAVIGIGLNVNTQFADAPADVQARATSLATEFGRAFDREVVLAQLLQHFAARYTRLTQPNGDPIHDYAHWLDTIGRPVKITLANGDLHGIAERIDLDGALIIRDAQGQPHRCVYGALM